MNLCSCQGMLLALPTHLWHLRSFSCNCSHSPRHKKPQLERIDFGWYIGHLYRGVLRGNTRKHHCYTSQHYCNRFHKSVLSNRRQNTQHCTDKSCFHSGRCRGNRMGIGGQNSQDRFVSGCKRKYHLGGIVPYHCNCWDKQQ